MKTAIVIGANGYLGRHLTYNLLQNKYQVVPCGYNAISIDNYPNYIQVDVTDPESLKQLNFNVDFVFVFAGLTGTSVGFKNYRKFIEVNEIGLLNILTAIHTNTSNARVVFPSTRLVYKGITKKALKEDSEKESLTIYAQNKNACESYLKLYNKLHNINYTIFRICVPYGNSFDQNYSYGTISFFLSKAKSNKAITLYGNGEIYRTFTHVEDICNNIIKAISYKKSNNQVFNIGSNDNMSLKDVAGLVAKKYNIDIEYVKWPEEAFKIESGDTIFDASKLNSIINYKFKHALINWIKDK